MQFNTNQIAFPVHLVWHRPTVDLSKHRRNLLDDLMAMQEHFGSLTIIPKEVVQTRRKSCALIEALEPDDSDEECVPQTFLSYIHTAVDPAILGATTHTHCTHTHTQKLREL